MKVLIIEDEIHSARDLMHVLKQVDPEIEVVQHAMSVKASMEYLLTSPEIDLIFSDIKLTDGLSFEIYEAIEVAVPVIFCTAYDEFALKAFKTNGIDYVLKPFSNAAIERALEKYHRLTIEVVNPNLQKLIDEMMKKSSSNGEYLLVHRGDKIIPVKVQDIVLFYVKDKYAFAKTANGKKYLISQTLEELGQRFSADFYRVNRQFIVKRSAIKEVLHQHNRKLKVILHQEIEDDILVGKLKITSFLTWLKG